MSIRPVISQKRQLANDRAWFHTHAHGTHLFHFVFIGENVVATHSFLNARACKLLRLQNSHICTVLSVRDVFQMKGWNRTSYDYKLQLQVPPNTNLIRRLCEGLSNVWGIHISCILFPGLYSPIPSRLSDPFSPWSCSMNIHCFQMFLLKCDAHSIHWIIRGNIHNPNICTTKKKKKKNPPSLNSDKNPK